VAGTVQRWWMLFLAHRSVPLVIAPPNA